MRIVEERISDVLVEIVNLNRATLSEANNLMVLIQRGINDGYVKIIVDISTCEYIDSSFLGVLVAALKKVANRGGDVKLVGFKPAVQSMFELTRMFRVFETFSDLQKALKSFSNK
ncbi:MAG: STAS domain-containing protein [Bacteroidetes bacterium]|nr:STAS domain-containing protein [Bacteroidota bacterium]MBU1679073.1 STAS domain-containing protein [Bacteroidota bacterium]MBU2507174.1 STAS domain-containing protein [Bacteroidota bacterium]